MKRSAVLLPTVIGLALVGQFVNSFCAKTALEISKKRSIFFIQIKEKESLNLLPHSHRYTWAQNLYEENSDIMFAKYDCLGTVGHFAIYVWGLFGNLLWAQPC